MKKLIYLFLTLIIVGCSGDEGGNNYPSLRVVNQTTDSNDRNIVSVKLLNYEFTQLNITPNNEQIFILDNGMPNRLEKKIKYQILTHNEHKNNWKNNNKCLFSHNKLKQCEFGNFQRKAYLIGDSHTMPLTRDLAKKTK